MSSKTKSVTAVLIVLALVAGVGMTKAGSKYKTQDKVNLIFANVKTNRKLNIFITSHITVKAAINSIHKPLLTIFPTRSQNTAMS